MPGVGSLNHRTVDATGRSREIDVGGTGSGGGCGGGTHADSAAASTAIASASTTR